MGRKVLVVDDEKLIVKGLKFSLEQENYEVICAYDGATGLEMARVEHPDVILLDVMLPEMDGLEVCSKIREFSEVPIIMLSAKAQDMDKIVGLESGADDYITKPFNILEVKARLKSILRRLDKPQVEKTAEKLVIDADNKRVLLAGKDLLFTLKEFEVIKLLSDNPGKIYSREDLVNNLWGNEFSGDARTVDVHIRRLREKLEADPANPEYVRTKWGIGYYFENKE